jgi:hypothetical protein
MPRWTLKLLANALVEVIEHPSVSRETIRRRLDDNDRKPWQQKMWCIAKIDGEYIARMGDLLDLYAEPHEPKRPVVCFDESPIQLIGEVRVPITPKPGKRYRYGCAYKRNGTANLFVMDEANRSWRKVKATRSLRRLEVRYTPKHALGLNMAEIEIGVMRRQGLDRRIDNRDLRETEVRAWERRLTESGAQIRWMFSTDQTRVMMAKSYPTLSLNES